MRSALFVVVIVHRTTADTNESSFNTDIWEFENQTNMSVILGAMISE